MKVTVKIHYHTCFGEYIRLRTANGTIHDMCYSANDIWIATLDAGQLEEIPGYKLELLNGDSVIRREWRDGQRLSVRAIAEDVVIYDSWHDMPEDSIFYTSMFDDAVFLHKAESVPPLRGGEVFIEVEAVTLKSGERLGIVGSTHRLGEWNSESVRQMTHISGVHWCVILTDEDIDDKTEYKFVVVDKDGRVVRWETGENRCLPAKPTTDKSSVVSTGNRLRDNNKMPWYGAGVAIPVFSLRSVQSCGIGEFADLRILADWCERCGEHVIQILPVNDTTATGSWRDSYPYNSNSTFALHPIYIRLSEIGTLQNKELQSELDKRGAELNALPQVDYESVFAFKMDYLRKLYDEHGDVCNEDIGYILFLERNISWLKQYAVYSVLRDRFGTADFNKWNEYARFDSVVCNTFAEENKDAVGFYYFVQYHLDKQLRAVRSYAHSKGVALKGDIPIGVSGTSVDVWTHRSLFVMDSSAGAPPDEFSMTGQNWGFPVYNWAEMSKDGYAWWRARLAKMSEYFDAYRIDHILGFFRIWEIPLDAVSALLGEFNPSMPYSEDEIRALGMEFNPETDVSDNYHSEDVLWLEYRHKRDCFYPRILPFSTQRFLRLSEAQQSVFRCIHDEFYYHRHDEFWRGVAEKRLSALVESTSMLACGEDLGMIPHCVPEVMNQQRILSLEIERMPKTEGEQFGNVERYPYLSVCTTSTHDMNPIRAWWQEDRMRSQRYYNDIMHKKGEAPEYASAELCRDIIERNLQSSSILTILPLQDWLSIDESLRCADPLTERINIPANSRHYWRYRMHITLEKLLSSERLNTMIFDMITKSGR